jgi:ribonuclease HI
VSTHKTVKISERAELRKKAWTVLVLTVIRLIKNFRTGTASIKWLKAHDEDQWNKKADELAKCGAQRKQMSGVHYNVMNDQKYANSISRRKHAKIYTCMARWHRGRH